jgi:hypothetical protein
MAGYVICSLDARMFEQLTTAPTIEQSLALADNVLDALDEVLDEYRDELAADHAKWSLDRVALAESIGRRLASQDWYADLTYGDAVIWCNQVLGSLTDEVGKQLGIDFRIENDGLYWDAAEMAAGQGATMMAEPTFGGQGFRNSRKSWSELELNYAFYLPADVQKLLAQLEKVRPHFETPCDEDEDEEWSEEQEQFFEELLEPVRRIAEEGRVLWVQTDT